MYCTKQDMIDRFGQAELVQRTDTTRSGAIDDVKLDAVMADARDEIDGYLSNYQLPLAEIPPLLVRISCDLARNGLYSNQVVEVVETRYKRAIKLLEAIAKGDIRLGLDSATSAVAVNASVVTIASSPGIFGRNPQ